MDYRDSHLQPGKGQSYHAAFSDDAYRNMVWQLEKGILDHILTVFYRNSEIHHFDFACGTGRILAHYENRVNSSVGVDLSPSMLNIARKNLEHSELIEADLTRDDVLGNRKFNLVTAFRFFPNAQPQLRMEAMRVMVKHLAKDGYIVFNNHKNLGSIRNRLARLCGRSGRKGMSMVDVQDLLARSGMEIERIYHLCVFPAAEGRMLLPRFLLRPIEVAFSRCTLLRSFAENLIIVCKRADNGSP